MNGESSLACGPWTCPILRPCLTAGRAWPGGCIRPPAGRYPGGSLCPNQNQALRPCPHPATGPVGCSGPSGGGPPLLSSIPAGAGGQPAGACGTPGDGYRSACRHQARPRQRYSPGGTRGPVYRLLRPVPEAHLPLWMGVDTFSGHPLKRKGDWTNHLKHATISLPFGPT